MDPKLLRNYRRREDKLHFYKSQKSLMKLSCDTPLKFKLEALLLPDFGICTRNGSMGHSQLAIDILLFFGTTYLCEKNTSSVTATKSNYLNNLQAESGLRVEYQRCTVT
jgi:hypothetical protein